MGKKKRNGSMKEQMEGIAIAIAPEARKAAFSKAYFAKQEAERKAEERSAADREVFFAEREEIKRGATPERAAEIRARHAEQKAEFRKEFFAEKEAERKAAASATKKKRNKKQEGGEIDSQMSEMLPDSPVGLESMHTMPDGTEMPGATHEEYEQNVMPDNEMEDEYLDFIVSESLNPEEEAALMSKLEADPDLSVMFDKLMDTATEFSGAGPVNGPGSEVSDSIPARLSDGEFVFTAKATEYIGADRLQSMMEDAEAEAESGRQEVATGGEIYEDTSRVDQYGKPVDKDITEAAINKSMLSVNPRLQ